jgi:hypothetical protein
MMTALKNPGLPGGRSFDTVVYASSGLNYAGVPSLNQYQVFDTPDPAFVTGRLDISVFANLGASVPWPFTNADVPVNGLLCIPRGRGPFPLALFAHGNHDPFENSTPGYRYLCELLASHGILAGTIDVNFLNGFNFGENDARAIVHLEHVKQFQRWNSTHSHPLHRKVDLDRILLVGHSRGGEGVGHASLFNRLNAIQPDAFSPVVPLDGSAGLGPYHFTLSAVAAIAPTDRQYEPLTGPTVVPDRYFLIHGSQDGDVSTFEGYNTYSRTHGVDLANPTVSDGRLKALLWVIGADHNQFNSVWAPEFSPGPVISRADQEQVAKVELGALAQLLLLGRGRYLRVLKDHAAATLWMPAGSRLVSQYQDPRRLFAQHNQEGLAPPEVSAPVLGTVASSGVQATRQLVDLVNAGAPVPTITLRLEWATLGGRFALDVNPSTLPADQFKTLSLRVGQSTEAQNPVGQDQDFTLEVSCGSRTAAVRASSLHRLLYPDVVFGTGKTVMQTLRLPLKRLARRGLEIRDPRSIALVFDRRPAGAMYVGEIQLSD